MPTRWPERSGRRNRENSHVHAKIQPHVPWSFPRKAMPLSMQDKNMIINDREGREGLAHALLLKKRIARRFSTSQFPKKIIYSTDWLPQENKVARELNEQFFKIIEDSMTIKRMKVSIADEWHRSAPEAVQNTPISEYLKNVRLVPNSHIHILS
jgi:hypothetical protein